RYRAAAEALVLYSTQIVPRAEANLNTIRTAYNLGEFSVFDIVNEQRRLIESETGLNDALRDYYAALAELERALGTTLPVSAFAPPTVSVLPDASVPRHNFGDLLPQRSTMPVTMPRSHSTQRLSLTQPNSNERERNHE
ncbi:MAG TPA: TolC family protein, partial [Pyrinomonadaceae bacterium]|nr:TolC family protein [Pyrinomonadaceae bacterium]